MSDQPRDLTLERIKRLTDAVADLMESHAAQGRHVNRSLERMETQLTALTAEVRHLASEQVLLGNRVEMRFQGRCAPTSALMTLRI
jgi:hypothetical protein